MCSGPDFSRDSAGGAEERNAPQPEGIDGPRRAQRQLKLKRIISTIALMKGLHQKITGFLQQQRLGHPPTPFKGGPKAFKVY